MQELWKTMKNLSQDSYSLCQDVYFGPYMFEARMLSHAVTMFGIPAVGDMFHHKQ
jgi:hypothetical protein